MPFWKKDEIKPIAPGVMIAVETKDGYVHNIMVAAPDPGTAKALLADTIRLVRATEKLSKPIPGVT